ncbi:MAG TPA: hypothetical protein VFT54_02280 [Acidimicrobiia bacterium]|nr:hypothetical protein [Acidimicrobiia bacterium]
MQHTGFNGPVTGLQMSSAVWVPDTPRGGGVRIENMVLFTEGEARILSRVEYEDRLLI